MLSSHREYIPWRQISRGQSECDHSVGNCFRPSTCTLETDDKWRCLDVVLSSLPFRKAFGILRLILYMSSGLKISGRARGAWPMPILILLRFRSSCSSLSCSSDSAFLLAASARSSGVRILAGSLPSSMMRCMSASAPCWIMPWLGQGSNGRLLKDSSQFCDS
jgi:hypothetical protein